MGRRCHGVGHYERTAFICEHSKCLRLAGDWGPYVDAYTIVYVALTYQKQLQPSLVYYPLINPIT